MKAENSELFFALVRSVMLIRTLAVTAELKYLHMRVQPSKDRLLLKTRYRIPSHVLAENLLPLLSRSDKG
jgi:hypothetical protein